MQAPTLRTSRWLAQRLGLSLTTVERLRVSAPAQLPPAIVIGASIRYDEATVEKWICDRMAASAAPADPHQGGDHVLVA